MLGCSISVSAQGRDIGGAAALDPIPAHVRRTAARQKAKVTIARKIAVILYRIWVDGTVFESGQPKAI